jgi:hypothetical protein
MGYIPPFALLQQKFKSINANGKRRLEMAHQDFIDLVKLMLRVVPINESWYLSQYPDVARAVKQGVYKSAKHHFVEEGYFEGRAPYEFAVDEDWYRRAYPDIAAGIRSGALGSAKEHFVEYGYREGRLPTEY